MDTGYLGKRQYKNCRIVIGLYENVKYVSFVGDKLKFTMIMNR